MGLCRSAVASVLTGRVLVIHAPAISLTGIVDRIEALLAIDPARLRSMSCRSAAWERPATAVKPLSYAVSNALSGFAALLRGFSSSFTRLGPAVAPAFGATAGAAALTHGGTHGGKQAQEILPWHALQEKDSVQPIFRNVRRIQDSLRRVLQQPAQIPSRAAFVADGELRNYRLMKNRKFDIS
jgi:hypothetical protein